MSGQLLDVTQAATGLEYQASRVGDEGSSSGVGRATRETQIGIQLPKPVHDAGWAHAARAATLGADHRTFDSRGSAEPLQRAAQIRVERYRAAATHLCRAVVQLDGIGNPPMRV